MPFGKTLPLPPSMSVSDKSLATPKGTLRKAQSLLQMSEQDSDAHFLCTESGLSQEAQMLAEMIPFLNGVFCSWHLCTGPKVLAELLGDPESRPHVYNHRR